MKVRVNGREMNFDSPLSVSGMLGILSMDAAAVVVEKNGHILEGRNFSETEVSEGESFEVVRLVGGG